MNKLPLIGAGAGLAVLVLVLCAKFMIRPSEGTKEFAAASEPTLSPISGKLELVIEPPPTEVRIDGQAIDGSQRVVELSQGKHKVEVFFEDLHRAEREVKLSPGKTERLELNARPEIAQARAKRLEENSFLGIESDPVAAIVILDGHNVGRTPLKIKGLAPGGHIVEFVEEGYGTVRRPITFEAGTKDTLRVELKILTGAVLAKGLRAGDHVRLFRKSGEEVNRADVPATGEVHFEAVKVGDYIVVVERPAHFDATAGVTVLEGRRSEVAGLAPKEKPGTIGIESEPPGADVWLNGQNIGRTPIPSMELAAGTVTLELKHPERSDWKGDVQVRAGESTRLRPVLPALGKLTVKAYPDGSKVTGHQGALKAGEAQVRVEHPEAGAAERRVQIRPGEETVVSVDLWAERGLELETAGKTDEAAKAYQKSRPDSREKALDRLMEACLALADDFVKAQEWSKAREAARQALRLRPGDPRPGALSAKLAYQEAIARTEKFAAKGEWAKARDSAEEALAISPGDPRAVEIGRKARFEVSMALGREKEGLGHWLDARRAIETALAARPESLDAKQALDRVKLVSWTELRSFGGYTFSVAFNPEGTVLAAGGLDKSLKLWNARDGSLLQTFAGHSGAVSSVVFGPQGKWVVSASIDKTLKAWNVKQGEEFETLWGHEGEVWSVAVSPDGKLLASGSQDQTIRLWDTAAWRGVGTLSGHSGVVSSVAFSPDGKWLASASGDKTVKLWNVERSEVARTFRGHADYVSQVAFDGSGKRLVSASRDNTLKLWDPQGGQELRTFRGHEKSVTYMAFSPDGRRLASVSEDRTIRLWDLESGQPLRSILAHSGEIWSIAFASDGNLIATAGKDGVRLWGLRK